MTRHPEPANWAHIPAHELENNERIRLENQMRDEEAWHAKLEMQLALMVASMEYPDADESGELPT